MVRKILLGCGIASSVLYVASDILVSWWDPNYSYRDQSFSELLARVSNETHHGCGQWHHVWRAGDGSWGGPLEAAGGRRTGRITGALLAGYAVTGAVTGVFLSAPTRGPGSGRGDVAQHHAPSRNGSVSALHPAGHRLRIHATGGGPEPTRTRRSSPSSCLASGSIQIGQMSANEPTPWLGIVERGNVYAIMLWVAVLAIGLRAQKSE